MLVASAVLSACATNPVTGKRELTLVSSAQEIAIGEQQYAPARQTQGGDYTADRSLVAYVRGVGQKLVVHSPRPNLPYEFAVLNNPVPNAWALPGGKIAINRGLLVQLESEAQLAAVLGHEIVHAAARHGAKSMERAILARGAVEAVSLATQGSEIGNSAVQGAALAAQLTQQKYGREAELESDRYGMEIMAKAGYDPDAAVELQEIFVRLSGGRESDWLEGLFASHPPSSERVAANRETALRLKRSVTDPHAWVSRSAEYRAAIARLVADAPAYASAARGSEALARGDAIQALAGAEKALAIDPDEPQFHALKSAAALALGEQGVAETSASRAVELAPDYHAWTLQRARVRMAGGDAAGARADLDLSLEQLPTAAAHFELGTLLEAQGQPQAAMEHYRVAASAGDAWMAQAGDPLARLELAEAPERWVSLDAVRDGRGYLTLELENRAPFEVGGIEIVIERPGEDGLRTDRLALEDTLAPGESLRRRTNLGPFPDEASFASVRAQLASARPVDR